MKLSTSRKAKQVFGAAVAAAAMALPSAHPAFAEAAPEKGIVAFKYLKYEDSQPGQERMDISAYSVRAMTPIAGKWSIDVTGTYDSVTGASPHYHTNAISGASSGIRRAVDMSVSHYFQSGSVTLGSSYSQETDYISRGVSLQGSYLTPSKNTTFTLGGSITTDSIDPTNEAYQNIDKRKKLYSWLAGITQVMSKNDIVQLNVGRSNGTGFFTDPYKRNDWRPDFRNYTTVMTKWNHYFESTDGSSRLAYRYYSDTFGIKAHTVSVEYVQPLSHELTVTPLLRYYSQTAADFYVPVGPDEIADPTVPTDVGDAEFYSEDPRLSAFGAVTLGIKVSKRFAQDWMLDVRYDRYMQRSVWALNGTPDRALADFNAHFIQLGISKEF
ncbi:MAG: DUF3570 domain-containing protein [Chlorobiaceae bacterium]|nr:DUF3570 domain-containing protein [Chlorobiaceae bacterium]